MTPRNALFVLGTLPLMSGCAFLDAHPQAVPTAVDAVAAGAAVVATATGNPWLVPLITGGSAIILAALNTHHGVRNVTVGIAKGVAGLLTPKPKV